MNPSAFQDVINGATKTIFVHVTAGDAGLGIGSGWPQASVLSGAGKRRGNGHPLHGGRGRYSGRPRLSSHRPFNGHPIYRVSYRNTVSYFLRVPDGNPLGTGYNDTGFQSLKRLADGENNTLSAIDGSTVYHGWSDLVATLRAILDYERGGAALVQSQCCRARRRASIQTITPII